MLRRKFAVLALTVAALAPLFGAVPAQAQSSATTAGEISASGPITCFANTGNVPVYRANGTFVQYIQTGQGFNVYDGDFGYEFSDGYLYYRGDLWGGATGVYVALRYLNC
ncbi:hypothetical protein ACIOKD_17025 [Streptomyces sp. NPDC087844]|uniref:hypothetical protein n=1 Tax=Streptomyces sp. NPDC087844 TaxID=3365805 RepID=UPI0037F618B2